MPASALLILAASAIAGEEMAFACGPVAGPSDAYTWYEATWNPDDDPFASQAANTLRDTAWALVDPDCVVTRARGDLVHTVATCTTGDGVLVRWSEVERAWSGWDYDYEWSVSLRVFVVVPESVQGGPWSLEMSGRVDRRGDLYSGQHEEAWEAAWTGTPVPSWPADTQANGSWIWQVSSGYDWYFWDSEVTWEDPGCAWSVTESEEDGEPHRIEVRVDGVETIVRTPGVDCGTIAGYPATFDGASVGLVGWYGWDIVGDDDVDGDNDRSLACGGGDCDDLDPAIHAGAPEMCDGHDDDCDGLVDDDDPGVRAPFWADGDGDGWGSADGLCLPVPGAATASGDCNDWDPDIHPGAAETWYDGTDQDCDDQDDWDADGDGSVRGPGDLGDCDDANPAVHPDADEIRCDGVDQDCDGVDRCPDGDRREGRAAGGGCDPAGSGGLAGVGAAMVLVLGRRRTRAAFLAGR